MAFYIRINKTAEDELMASYAFEGNQGRRGLLSLNKLTGEANLVEPMPDDDKRHFFNRAAVKVVREWKEGKLPDFLEWAS